MATSTLASRDAFRRMLNSRADHYRKTALAWNTFIERYHGTIQVSIWRGDKGFQKLYREVLSATTVQSKSRAIRAILARYNRPDRKD